jgi:hypothetical protein
MAWETGETDICLGCGRPMAPRAGLMVCSTRCYQRDFRARRRRERRKICLGCRREFCPARSDAVFCSLACKHRAHRARKAAKAETVRKAIDLAASLIG